MNKPSIVVPLIALSLGAGLTLACNTTPDDTDTDVRAAIRVNAAVQADIAGLAGVHVELLPAEACQYEGFMTSDGTPYADELDITNMAFPDGSPFRSATEYVHVLAEAAFGGVVPGCYDVVAFPFGEQGEPLPNCRAVSAQVAVAEYGSAVVDIPVECSEVPRLELDVAAANHPPQVLSITAEPMVSACELTMVCATAIDADRDMLEFAWPQPEGVVPGGSAAPRWPTVLSHTWNEDRSVTQCIAVQAREAGSYEVGVEVYDLALATDAALNPLRIEDLTGTESHASDAVSFDATLGCEPVGRSAVVLMTLGNEPGMPRDAASTLIANTVAWVHDDPASAPSVLVVLDDNHRGEDAGDGEYVHALMVELGLDADYMLEPAAGLDYDALLAYDAVWFVNPGYEMDDPISHTALLRYRASGGGLVLQGDDIARFWANPEFMQPLTYLSWHDNGTNACGLVTDNNRGDSYTVSFEVPTSIPTHPIAEGLRELSFAYGNDIDYTRPLAKGEQVVAWASVETETCELRTPAVVALDPALMLPL